MSFINITVCSFSTATNLSDLGFDGSPMVGSLCKGRSLESFSSKMRSKPSIFRGDRRRISSRPGDSDVDVVLPLAKPTESPDIVEFVIGGIDTLRPIGISFLLTLMVLRSASCVRCEGGGGAGLLGMSRALVAASSRRSRSLAAAVARSIVLIFVNGWDELSLLAMTGLEIPMVRTVDGVTDFGHLKRDNFCW
jgi:hypothetical protein